MSKNQEYAQQYAEYAMEQMKKYGIPASVTLAQGILESSNGKSQLAINENNHFGIKATSAWIEQGGKYGLYSDDKPNEKFCSYESVADSYEHHSKFLKENSRYAECFKLSPDDYKGWTETIAKAGYASGKEYATQLQRIIEINGLDKYDKMVMEQKALAVSENKSNALEYSFPLEREEYLFITSPFGSRKDPLDSTKEQMHQGIDIRCNFEKVLSTENNGKVVSVNHNAQSSDGKSITVEYERENGKKVQVYYSHLSEINVKYFMHLPKAEKLNAKWDLMQEYAPIVTIKEIGGFDSGSGRSAIEVLGEDRKKGLEKVPFFFQTPHRL